MNTGTQLAIADITGSEMLTPRAAILQREVTTADGILTKLARENGHNCLWWWGIKRSPKKMAAFCYVCDTPIVFGALNNGITPEQSVSIDEHRASHWEEVLRGHQA